MDWPEVVLTLGTSAIGLWTWWLHAKVDGICKSCRYNYTPKDVSQQNPSADEKL